MRRLRRLRHFAQYAALRTAVALLGAVPFRARVALCTGVARAALSLGFEGQARQNLKIAFGDSLPRAKRREIRRANARALGRLVAELVDYLRRGRDTAERLVFADPSISHLHAALALGRGVVVVTPHFGNWELFPAYLAIHGHRGGVVARTPTNPHIARLLAAMRHRAGVPTLDTLRDRRKTLELLRSGGIVGLLPDLDLKRASGIFLPFFGKEAWTSTGPAHLAVAAEAPLLTAYILPEGPRYRLVFEEALRPDPTKGKREEIERLTRAWSARFEARIREKPELWVWMHPRWATTPAKARERLARASAVAAP